MFKWSLWKLLYRYTYISKTCLAIYDKNAQASRVLFISVKIYKYKYLKKINGNQAQ